MKNERTPPFLKVGEVATRAGVGVQTLHYYEKLGLIPKPSRSKSNYRVFPEDTLRRVLFIKKAQTLGFTLHEIKEIFDLQQRGAARCNRVTELAESRLHELGALVETLQGFCQSLSAALPDWKTKTACRENCAGEFCDLIEKLPAHLPVSELKRKLGIHQL